MVRGDVRMRQKRIGAVSPTRMVAAFAILTMLQPAAAWAYVGPGAGLTAIGTLVALVLAVVLAIVGFVWYPLKRLMRKRRAAPEPTGAAQERE